jgi:cytochrome P450
MQRDLLAHCVALAKAHGDVVAYRLGPIPVFQLTHPDAAHEVLVAQHRAFRKPRNLVKVLGQWNGKGLVVNEGESWLRQRRLVHPAFKPQRLAAHVEAVARRTGELLAAWEGRGEVDASGDLGRLTFGVVAEALFGADVAGVTDRFLAAVAVLNEIGVEELTSPVVFPMWMPLPSKRRLREAVGVVDGTVRGIIAGRRKKPEDRGDLLSALLLAVDEEGDGGGMSEEQARDEAVGLLLGGNETTATALTWALHLLAAHPEEQDRAAAEAASVLGDGPPTAESLPRLQRTTWIFKEAIRLYPPAYILAREAEEAVTVAGLSIPRGAAVQVVPFITQRDGRWFEGPEAFLPDRFAREDAFRRGSYLPFGMGPRACIGRALSMMEAPLALAMILRRYRLAPAAGAGPVELEAQVSLHPKGGLRLAVAPRS